jgi:hypothetical protein
MMDFDPRIPLALELNRASLLCLRMALARNLQWIDECHFSEQPAGTSHFPSTWAPLKNEFLRGERERTHKLLEQLPEA